MRFIYSMAAFFAILLSSSLVFAGLVIPSNIEDLGKSDVAFRGVCIERDPYRMNVGAEGVLPATSFTFQVEEVLKGDVGETFTFTQFGVTKEEAVQFDLPYIYGIPQYQVGIEYTVFLTKETSLGFRAPVGLGYGKFMMIRTADGSKAMVNGYGNRNLFGGVKAPPSITKAMKTAGFSVSKPAPKEGPVNYEQFKTMFQSLQE